MGDPNLYQKMTRVLSAITRGIIDTPSLYLSGESQMV